MRLLPLACLGLAACGTPAPHADPTLVAALRAIATSAAPRQVCVAYREVDGPVGADLDAEVVLHAASTMKLPVMIELFRRIDAGSSAGEARLVVRNRFRSIVDGSPFALDPADDSDPELYARLGEPVACRELCEHMIRRSSNLATNLLIDELGAPRVQATIEALGAVHGMKVLRGVEDGPAFRAGLNNVATAADLAALLCAIADGRAASSASCREMLEILCGQEFRDMIPAGLPDGTVVANKTGTITRIHHDAAIVDPFGPRPFVLVVMTAGFEDEHEASAVGARIARLVANSR